MLRVTDVSEMMKPRKSKVRPQKYTSNGTNGADAQLGIELVSSVIGRGHKRLSLTVEVAGRSYRIVIEPDKKMPVLHERW